MATLRERKPGVWEIRVFTGRDSSGRPTQISRTVRGTKREAQRVAATLESRPPSNAAGRTVTDVLTAWRDVNQPVWAESTRRDYESRIARIESADARPVWRDDAPALGAPASPAVQSMLRGGVPSAKVGEVRGVAWSFLTR